MALNIINKLKNVDLSKTTETFSEVKTSFSNMFDKKKTSSLDDVTSDDMQTEWSDDKFSKEELINAGQKAKSLIEKQEELQEKIMMYLSENSDKLKKWYSDSQFNEKIAKVAKKAGGIIIYPVLLLFNLMKSPETSVKDKMLIIAPLAYFVLPTDLIPDFIMGAGYVDDSLAVMKCLQSLSSSITPRIREEAKLQCESIFGEMDDKILEQVSEALIKNQNSIVTSLSEVDKKSKQLNKDCEKGGKNLTKK